MNIQGFGRIPASTKLDRRQPGQLKASFAPAPAVDDSPNWRQLPRQLGALAAYEQTQDLSQKMSTSQWLGIHEYV